MVSKTVTGPEWPMSLTSVVWEHIGGGPNLATDFCFHLYPPPGKVPDPRKSVMDIAMELEMRMGNLLFAETLKEEVAESISGKSQKQDLVSSFQQEMITETQN